MSPAFDVLGVGQCCQDYLGVSGAFPVPDSKCELDRLATAGGGPTATALVALTRWGLRCTFDSVVGDDVLGFRIRTDLEAAGIDIEGVRIREQAESQFAFIHALPGVGHRTIFWHRPTGRPLAADELNADAIAAARLFYTDGLQLEAALAGARIARDAGVPVFADCGTLREGVLELAALSDVFIVSEPFSESLCPGDHEASCRTLQARGPRLTGVTLGSEGYLVRDGDSWIRGAAVPVDAVDTTGCGDVFHAGVAYGFLQGWATPDSLRFAAWAASHVATALGGRAGIPDVAAYTPEADVSCSTS